MIVDVSSAVAIVASGALGGAAVWGAWLVFTNWKAVWTWLDDDGGLHARQQAEIDAYASGGWRQYHSGGGVGSGGGSSSAGAPVESWGLSDVLSSSGGSSSSSSDRDSASSDTLSGGGGEFGGGGSESDF